MRGKNDLRYLRMLRTARGIEGLSPRPVMSGLLVAFMEGLSGVRGEEWRLINQARYHLRRLKVTEKGKVARGSENTILKIWGGRE